EDGIRDGHVTGVQTCALPIWNALWESAGHGGWSGTIARARADRWLETTGRHRWEVREGARQCNLWQKTHISPHRFNVLPLFRQRSDFRFGIGTAQRHQKIRAVFSFMSRARHLFSAVAIRDRIYFHRS